MKNKKLTPSENFDFSQIKSGLVKKTSKNFDFSQKSAENYLFEDFEFNNLKLKNHFVFNNFSDNFLCDNFGNPTEKYKEFYTNIAKGDVSLILTGGSYVGTKRTKNISKLPKKFAILSGNKKNISTFQNIIKEVHVSGAKIFMTLKPIFGRGDLENKFLNIFNYSASFGRNFYDAKMPCIRLSDGKCNELAENFGESASHAIGAGFDGIVVDGTLFNIIGEFSSKEFNRRNFGYYTEQFDLSSRILHEIKKSAGEINILYKFTLSSFLKGVYGVDIAKLHTLKGIKKSDSKEKTFELLEKLVDFGVDGFIFEFGTYETSFLNDFSQFMQENLFAQIYKEIKDYFNSKNLKNKFGNNILIISTDNFNSSNSAQNNLLQNSSDMINVTKQIYSDNNFIRKLKSKSSYVPCIKCSKCNEQFEKFDELACTVNPNIFGKKLPKTNRENKSVAVVGAGIAGINCAIWLAMRGFQVELFEKNKTINKIGKLSEIFGYDELMCEYNKYLENQLNKFTKSGNIKLMLGSEFFAENTNQKSYCSIVVATGFHEKYLNVSGAVLSNVKSIYDVLNSNSTVASKKNIVILARSELSLKLAIYLLTQNKKVSLIISKSEFLFKMSNGKLTYYLKALKDLHASVYPFARVKRIEEDFVELKINGKLKKENFDTIILNNRANIRYNYETRAKNIELDLFVYEPELYSNNRLYYELAKAGFAGELYMIGNALTVSDMENDIKNAFYVAKNL